MRTIDDFVGVLIRTIGLPLIIGGAGLLYILGSDDSLLVITGFAVIAACEVLRRLASSIYRPCATEDWHSRAGAAGDCPFARIDVSASFRSAPRSDIERLDLESA